jgi:hypothetical protein
MKKELSAKTVNEYVKYAKYIKQIVASLIDGEIWLEDINNFWMAHKPKTMSKLYSHPSPPGTGKRRIGYGFEVPAFIAPSCSKESVEAEVAVAA